MAGTADLASVLVPQTTGVLRYGMGRIISWNSETFENVVEWLGTPVPNMLIANPTDALSYESNMLVSLIGIDSSGNEGVTQWVIWGRLIQPGASAATQAVDFLRGALAREISAQVFADRIQTAFDPAVVERDQTSWGDPTNGAPPGPSVTCDVSSAGLVQVTVGCNTISSTEDGASVFGNEGGLIGIEVSGATALAPDNNRILRSTVFKYNDGGPVTEVDGVRVIQSMGVTFSIEVNPGINLFTMKFARSGSANMVVLDNRYLSVTAF